MVPEIVTLSRAKKTLFLDYDKEADVLYISFKRPQRATDTEMVSDDVLLRRRDNDLVGVTILHASKYH